MSNITGVVYYGLAVASPYVGMTQKQDGSSNQCISVYTAILSPGNKMLTSIKALKAAYAAPCSLYSSTNMVVKCGHVMECISLYAGHFLSTQCI